MRIINILMLLTAVSLAASSQASETTVHGRIYSHWMDDLGNGFNEFDVTRSYLTVRSELSDKTSLRITSDLRSTGENRSEFNGYTIILKYAFLDWKPNFASGHLNLRIGLHPTQYTYHMNKVWNRRYLSTTVGDLHGFLTASDFGISAIAGLGRNSQRGQLSFSILNGTKYTDVEEENKNKDLNLFGRFYPLHNNEDFAGSSVMGQIYLGTQNRTFGPATDASDYDKQLVSAAGLLAYRSTFDLGFDLNFLSEGQGAGTPERKRSGHSFFGTLYFEGLAPDRDFLRNVNIFGRLDFYDPDTDASDDSETHLIIGLECRPVKGVKAAINIRSTSYDEPGVDSNSYLYFSTLVKF